MDETPLERAVRLAGGQSELGRRIGAPQQLIWHWLNKAKRVPAEWAIPIEQAVDGQVTRSELRPDIYPPDEAGAESAPNSLPDDTERPRRGAA